MKKGEKILWLLQWTVIDEAGFMRLGTLEAPIKEHMILQIALRQWVTVDNHREIIDILRGNLW